jgi:hypothetical protein
MAPRIAIIHVGLRSQLVQVGRVRTNTLQYSLYGHIEKLALAELKGIQKAAGTANIYR